MSQRLFRRKALEKLASPERLDQLMSITTVRGWLALLALGSLIVAIGIWGFFAKIPTTISGEGILRSSDQDMSSLEGVLYVSVWDGMRVQPGMVAKISPVTVVKEEHGLLLGRVASVERTASTYEQMLFALGNDTLVQTLASSGNLIEIRVDLEVDEKTPSGYRWTSVQGPPTPVQNGTICSGVIVIAEQRPVELVFSR
ncbi:MAG: hypothetical protein GTO14_24005 [Anaerolineales bacterium]|nr:hypothetical protein [Anaerolineales bacterium]